MTRLSIAAILAALAIAACTGGALGPSARPLLPSGRNSDGPSSMAPVAATQDLAYISDEGTNVVYVYSWPQMEHVGTLKGFTYPQGECVDAEGDVWIVDSGTSEMIEYAHAGTKPIARLKNVGFRLSGCSVDPVTGNLAVTVLEKNANSSGDSGGYVAVFKNARGTAQQYGDHDGLLEYPTYCAYDDKGNLYVDGSRGINPWWSFVFAKLPAGGSGLTDISLNQNFNYSGGVQWHKPYVAIGDSRSDTVYEFAIRGAYGYENVTTPLDGSSNVFAFAIRGDTLIGPNSGAGNVMLWKFPEGGQPTKTLTNFSVPIAAVVSPASARDNGAAAPLGTVFSVSTFGKERVLYRFSNTLGDRGNGEHPYAGLTAYDGALYGTTVLGTFAGGTYNGSVFESSPGGSERTLHLFASSTTDGMYPYSPLTPLDGRLYGTTSYGGTKSGGTFFTVDPASGKERILYNFPAQSSPESSLTVVNGLLYGTTSGGGTGCGSVFSISTAGREHSIYDFQCKGDGAFPHAGVIALDGMLYGTTTQGGESGGGYGTIFSVTTSGVEKVLHVFAGHPSDGAYAFGNLIAVSGLLFGTTIGGGSSENCTAPDGGYGCGTVYTVTPSGSVSVLYSFTGATDGAFPYQGLLSVKGALYGTTTFGGGSSCNYYGTGCGTIFKMTTSGKERILYRFAGGTDGANPYGGLTQLGGTLYGATYYGGARK
jgi:uncharacterized repeat protein (TIGR03803 family)